MELEAKNNFVALNEAARPFYIIKAGHENGNAGIFCVPCPMDADPTRPMWEDLL